MEGKQGWWEWRKCWRINNIKDTWKSMRGTCYYSFLLKIHRKYTILHTHIYIPMLNKKHTQSTHTYNLNEVIPLKMIMFPPYSHKTSNKTSVLSMGTFSLKNWITSPKGRREWTPICCPLTSTHLLCWVSPKHHTKLK